jgi:hypothetical protein
MTRRQEGLLRTTPAIIHQMLHLCVGSGRVFGSQPAEMSPAQSLPQKGLLLDGA